VAADAAAYRRLLDAGLPAGRMLRLGPTVAIAAPGEELLTYDDARWQVDVDGGELLLTNLVDRLTPCDALRTGVRGTVTEAGRLLLD
jgi:hypothetical protein